MATFGKGRTYTSEEVEQLLQLQLQNFTTLGVSSEILQEFVKRKDGLIKAVTQLAMKEHIVPFLLVIPTKVVPFMQQVPWVKRDGVPCTFYRNEHDLWDTVKTPWIPYFLINVEPGRAMRGKSVEEAEILFKKHQRFPLTLVECMALCVHYNTLSHEQWIDAAGSRIRDTQVSEMVPDIFCSSSGSPHIGKVFYDGVLKWSGAPSCGLRKIK